MQPDGNTYDHPARRWIYERHRIGTNGEQSWKRPRFTVDCIANRRRREEGREEGKKEGRKKSSLSGPQHHRINNIVLFF
jgi:hypothetical protein